MMPYRPYATSRSFAYLDFSQRFFVINRAYNGRKFIVCQGQNPKPRFHRHGWPHAAKCLLAMISVPPWLWCTTGNDQ